MAVFYRLHQDQSTGTKRSAKWYARAVPTAVIGTRQLAEISSGGGVLWAILQLKSFLFFNASSTKNPK